MVSNLSMDKLCEFKAAFELIDKDCKGTITIRDLIEFFSNLGQNFSEEDLIEMIKEAGLEGKRELDFEIFLSMITKNLKETDTEVEISEAYKKFDPTGNGNFSVQEFKTVLLDLGENLSSYEIDQLVDSIEVDENGEISYDSFVNFMGRL
jgi:Ca2+-binding EF-hand superfamily protein